MMPERGSAGNVIAALCSLFIPGFGQLLQGRPLAALIHFIIAGLLYLVGVILTFGLLPMLVAAPMHLWSCLSAAWFRPEEEV